MEENIFFYKLLKTKSNSIIGLALSISWTIICPRREQAQSRHQEQLAWASTSFAIVSNYEEYAKSEEYKSFLFLTRIIHSYNPFNLCVVFYENIIFNNNNIWGGVGGGAYCVMRRKNKWKMPVWLS